MSVLKLSGVNIRIMHCNIIRIYDDIVPVQTEKEPSTTEYSAYMANDVCYIFSGLFLSQDSRFVEDRRRLLQDYLRRVVNLYVTSDQGLRSETTKTTLLQILPFFA